MKYLIVIIFSLLVCKQSMYAQAINTAEGRQIFMTRCTSCHAINKEVVGPALRDVDKRHTAQWIINFVHSSQTVIKSGDTAAIALFKSHNNTVMPDHPDLKNEQIQDIIAFIKEQSNTVPIAEGKNSESFTKPYGNKNGLLSQIVYLNFDGNHLPVKPGDTLSWILVGLIVIILVVVLYLVVLTNQITDKYYETRKNKQ
jgi:cytochrome c2